MGVLCVCAAGVRAAPAAVVVSGLSEPVLRQTVMAPLAQVPATRVWAVNGKDFWQRTGGALKKSRADLAYPQLLARALETAAAGDRVVSVFSGSVPLGSAMGKSVFELFDEAVSKSVRLDFLLAPGGDPGLYAVAVKGAGATEGKVWSAAVWRQAGNDLGDHRLIAVWRAGNWLVKGDRFPSPQELDRAMEEGRLMSYFPGTASAAFTPMDGLWMAFTPMGSGTYTPQGKVQDNFLQVAEAVLKY